MIVQAARAAAAPASFGARVSPALPWLLAGIVLLLLAIAVVLFLVLRKSAGTAPDPEPAAEDPDAEPLRLPAAPRQSFAAGVAALRRYVPGRDARYRIPWVLMLGAEGSGKSAVADHVGLPRPISAGEDARGRDGLRWGFFEQGVLLDLPGAWLRREGGAGVPEWRTFLRLLRWFRPGRPLDAVVLTVAADELAGPRALGRDELLARAEGLRQSLTEAQLRLGVRFPVHVLVTRCDRVPGFTATCRELPAAARDEVFGWSSPYPTEAAFAPAWADEAYEAVDRCLYEAQVELLAGSAPAHADGLFRFPGELRRTLPSLRTVLGEVFRESAYHERFFFRGIFFTGDDAAPASPAQPGDDAAPAVAAAPDPALSLPAPPVPADGEAGGPVDAPEAAPVFLRQLFAERVFAEAGLAQPVDGVLAGGRGARAAQIAAAVLILLGTPALLVATHRLNRTGTRIETALSSTRLDLAMLAAEGRDTASARSGGQVDVLALVDTMGSLPMDRLWSPVVPASWVSGVRRQLGRTGEAALRQAVYPAMRQRLEARARTLTDDSPAEQGAWHAVATPEMLADYLRELAAFSDNVNRYNRLASRGEGAPADLEGLAAYLYQVRHAAPTASRRSAYEWAVRTASADSLRGDRTDLAVRRAKALAESVYDRLAATLAQLENGAAAPDGLPAAGGASPYEAEAMETEAGFRGAVPIPGGYAFAAQDGEFDALPPEAWGDEPTAAPFDPSRLRAYFSGPDSAWLAPAAPLPATLSEALAQIPTSGLISAPAFRREFTEGFIRERQEHLSEMESADGGAFAGPGGGGARSLVPLRDALATLNAQEFTAGNPPVRLGGRVPPGAPVAWDTVALGAALSRYAGYQAFITAPSVTGLPARGRNVVSTLARGQLESGMTSDVARAARGGGTGDAYLAGSPDRALRARVAGMQAAAGQLAQVLAAYRQLGMDPPYEDLAGVLAEQGEAVLAGAEALLDQQGLYVPQDGGFDWWEGETPVAFPAFGVRDTAGVDAYLASQLAAVQQVYTAYVQPVLALLDSEPMAAWNDANPPAAQGALDAAARWRGIAAQIAAYTAKKPSSLGALESLIGQGMLAVAPGNCAPASRRWTGTDWFARRREAIRAPLWARCRQLSARAAALGYRELRDAFQSGLAGRFPFAAADARADADPAAVADFFRLYAAREGTRRSVATGNDGVGGPGSAAAGFLARLDAVAAFLAPVFAADTAGGPAYLVSAEFRVAREREEGADQVAGWQLRVGDASLTPRDSAGAALPWSPGAPVWGLFRWADGSPVRPSAAGLPWPARADGAQLAWGYGGEWGLLRLLRARATPGGAHTLAFPSALVAAPGTVLHPDAPRNALLFVRVRLADPVTGHAKVLPSFPTEAPALGAGDES